MAFAKLADERKRVICFGFRMTRQEHFVLRCIANRLNMTLADACRRLIEEDNERHHYDLIEPEYMRPRNQGWGRNSTKAIMLEPDTVCEEE